MPKERIRGKCFLCGIQAVVQYDCRTCETFSIKACRKHEKKGMYDIRQHALLKHPVNILRVAAAALKGE